MTPIYDWSTVPLTVRIHDVARVQNRSVAAIREDIKYGRMVPAPRPRRGKTSPYTWSRHDLELWWKGQYRLPVEKVRGATRHFFGKARSA